MSSVLQRLLPFYGYSHPCRTPIEKLIKLKGKEIPLQAWTGPEGF